MYGINILPTASMMLDFVRRKSKLRLKIIVPFFVICVVVHTLLMTWSQHDYSELVAKSKSHALAVTAPTTAIAWRVLLPTNRSDFTTRTAVFNQFHSMGSLLAGTVRQRKGHLALGIPTIRRYNGTYLLKTLKSLIQNMSPNEQNDTTIIVFLADVDDNLKTLTLSELRRDFRPYMNSGLLRIISAPKSFYPSFQGLKRSYSYPMKRLKWSAKQNYDYAFLFLYSVDISEYYMHLEDDVITIPGYVKMTADFVASQKSTWVCLELSSLGYIGKLYKSRDLPELARTITQLYQDHPPDVSYLHFNRKRLQNERIVRVPAIFQHIGYHSSLSGKIQTIRDPLFEKFKQYGGDNPPAKITTTFSTYDIHGPRFAYREQYGVFWTQEPLVNNYLLLVFDRPEKVERVIISTGIPWRQDDIIKNGVVELSRSVVANKDKNECSDYVHAGKFNRYGYIEIRNITELMKADIRCMKVKVTAPQEQWIIFREIAVFLTSSN